MMYRINAKSIEIEPAPFWYRYGVTYIVPSIALAIGVICGWALAGMN